MSPLMFTLLRILVKSGGAEYDSWIHWDQRPVIACWNRGYLKLSGQFRLTINGDGLKAFESYSKSDPKLRGSEIPPRFVSGAPKKHRLRVVA